MLLYLSPVGVVGRFGGGEEFYNLMINSHSFSGLETWDCDIPKYFPSVVFYSFSLSLSLEIGMLVGAEVRRMSLCQFV